MNASDLVILAGVLCWLATCLALLDIGRKDFGGIEKKAAWAFLAMVPVLGVILYLISGFRKGRNKAQTDSKQV